MLRQSCVREAQREAVKMMAAAAAMMMPAKMPPLPSLSPLEIALAPPQILMMPQKNYRLFLNKEGMKIGLSSSLMIF